MSYPTNLVLENMIGGWTRVEMLIALYNKTIVAIESAKLAYSEDRTNDWANYQIEANRLILGLFSGLDLDNCEIAQNVGRILTYVAGKLAEKEFDHCLHHLTQLQQSFIAIQNEAVRMEKEGQLPPIIERNAFDTVA